MMSKDQYTWFDRCDNCEKELPNDQMHYDRNGCPICPECWALLKDDPEFKVEPENKEK